MSYRSAEFVGATRSASKQIGRRVVDLAEAPAGGSISSRASVKLRSIGKTSVRRRVLLGSAQGGELDSAKVDVSGAGGGRAAGDGSGRVRRRRSRDGRRQRWGRRLGGCGRRGRGRRTGGGRRGRRRRRVGRRCQRRR